jgi:dihydrofolate reductase
MGRVVAIEHLSLDGVMQGPARPDEDQRDNFEYGGWALERNDPAMQAAMGARMGTSWSLLAGRITYEDLMGAWAKPTQPNPFSDALNRIEKFVVSTTLREPLSWQNSTLLKGDPSAAVARLKKESDKTFVIFGSGMLVQSLMRQHLVDEFLLMIHPIVLGSGLRLFPHGVSHTTLRLSEATMTQTGVIIASYCER